jgi:hypothetical protein
MLHRMSAVVALCVAAGCSGSSDPVVPASPPATVLDAPSPATFAGTWRSVTPSLEFVRLTVNSKSSEAGALAARLTFSGVAWEGSGRIEGDALVANMTMPGLSGPSSVIVARAPDARTLRVEMRTAAAPTMDLEFVREN